MNQWYLVAGASSGIGAAITTRLLEQGECVVMVARREERMQELVQGRQDQVMILPFDLMDIRNIGTIFERIKENGIKLSGMIYCAGICFVKSIKAMEESDLESMFRINVFAFYEMCRFFQRRESSLKGASVVGISSYAAFTKEAGMSAYSMTKEAMNTQISVLAKEFIKRKIRINGIMPANVKSKMACEKNLWSEEELDEAKKKQPFGVIPIECVVDTIWFLLSDSARFITGETIAISGGYNF